MPLVTSPSDIRGYSQANQPAVVPEGGLWYDTSVDTLFVSDGATFNTIGASSFAGAAVVSQSVTIGNYTTPTSATASSSNNVVLATGGTITTSGAYTIHSFTSSGTLTFSNGGSVDYLVIAGGAGGGDGAGGAGGGGGSGGFRTANGFTVATQAYSITVGAGGAGAPTHGAVGSSGSDSIFSSITSLGGGGGSGYNTSGSIGGSGGGGSSGGGGGSSTGIAGTSGQGFAGGNGATSTVETSGGGGGSSAIGTNGNGTNTRGNGGAGTSSSITGSSVTYAGGGGGSGGSGASGGGIGGTGGGGAGALRGTSAGVAGTANTGSGGGGGSIISLGYGAAAGGSGIVIIRYLTSSTSNLLFDDNTSTRWTSNSEINPNCYVDQGSSLNFAGAAFFYDNVSTTTINLLIQTSTDGITWTTKRTITTSNLVSGYNYYRFNIATGVRYVRFYGNDSGAKVLSIYEIKIYQRTEAQILNDLGILEISPTDSTLNAAGT